MKRKHRNQVNFGRKRRSSRTARIAPRTVGEFFAKSERFQDRWNRVTHTVAKMRANGVSLKQASKEFGLDPRTMIRWAKPGLRKQRNGRYAAKPKDTLLRVLTIPSLEGLREIAVRDSRQASRLGEYWAAVQKYLATGDTSALEKFRRKRITDASRKRIPLLTNLEELDRLASAGVLSFESLYARVV